MKNLSQQPITIPPEPEVWPSLTIILPERNEEIVLKKKLENLEAHVYPIDKIELIVIDSYSSDSTLDILEEWDSSRKSKFTLSTIIMDKHLGKSAAINRILEENFESDAMVITDADALLAPNSLKRVGRWLHFHLPFKLPCRLQGRDGFFAEEYGGLFLCCRCSNSI